MSVRVIVCGSRFRKTKDFREDFLILDYIHNVIDIRVVIHGGARGIDHMAELWGAMWLRKNIKVSANWVAYGRSAGYRRNAAMADMRPDYVIAFPGGKGTRMMREIAQRRGIPLIHTVNVNVPEDFIPEPNNTEDDDE